MNKDGSTRLTRLLVDRDDEASAVLKLATLDLNMRDNRRRYCFARV